MAEELKTTTVTRAARSRPTAEAGVIKGVLRDSPAPLPESQARAGRHARGRRTRRAAARTCPRRRTRHGRPDGLAEKPVRRWQARRPRRWLPPRPHQRPPTVKNAAVAAATANAVAAVAAVVARATSAATAPATSAARKAAPKAGAKPQRPARRQPPQWRTQQRGDRGPRGEAPGPARAPMRCQATAPTRRRRPMQPPSTPSATTQHAPRVANAASAAKVATAVAVKAAATGQAR